MSQADRVVDGAFERGDSARGGVTETGLGLWRLSTVSSDDRKEAYNLLPPILTV